MGLSSSEEKSMNKNKMEILGGTLAGMMFLSGCKPASETNKTPVVDASATLSGPTTKESPYVTYSPTKEVFSTATPTRPDMGGGAYNSEQQTLIETGAFKDSEQALTAWFKYWANASNSPFNPETTDIHYKYVFDSTGKNAGVCMESTAYSSVCFALPIINGEVAKVPPTVNSEYTIPVGYGPLQLSDQLSADQVSTLKLDTSLTDSVLGYENGDWVRIKNGAVVGTLDLKTAQWVVVEKELTIADITPANMIYDEGTNSSVDGSDEAFKTGIVSDPDMERGYAVDVSERDFGNTGLKYKLLSGFVTDKVSYDEGTNLLRVPMAIMVDGSLRHFNVISYCGGEHNVIGIKYMVGRGNLSGYDYQSMEILQRLFRLLLI